MSSDSDVIKTDVVIIGAGPTGLFQVFELGLLGISAHVVESLPQAGGQCSELYPDKPIYDIPAFPSIDAQELTDRLLQQCIPFDPVFHFNNEVVDLQRQSDGRLLLSTQTGLRFITQSVVIAAGMGSFQPVTLKVPNTEHLVGNSIHYKVSNPQQYNNKNLVVLGGGDSALDWALTLQPIAQSVTLIHRSSKFRAAPASVNRMHNLVAEQAMLHLTGSISEVVTDDADQLTAVKVQSSDGVTRRLEADTVLVFFGLSPKLGPINDWDLELHKNQIAVDTQRFQTSQQGIYAVGDINFYPGKKKLILSGFHEAALAAFAIKEQLQPDKKVHLQYTTTSPIMHQRLGLKSELKPAA